MPQMPQVPSRGAIVRFAAANAAANAAVSAAANATCTSTHASHAARQAAERTGLRETIALRADAPAFFSTQLSATSVATEEPMPTPPAAAADDERSHEQSHEQSHVPPASRAPQLPLTGAYGAGGASESAALECYRALVSAASQSGYDEQNAVGAWAQITWFGLQVFGFSPPPNDAVAQTAGHPGLMYLPPASPA